MEQREQLLKSISDMLDETLDEYEKLQKADTECKDLKLQPDENGDMPKEAGQGAKDDFKGLKKDEEGEEKEKEKLDELKDVMEDEEKDEKEEKKEVEKKKKVKKAEECDEEEEEKKKKEEKEVKKADDDETFKDRVLKALLDLELIQEEDFSKSEDDDAKEEVIEKSEAEDKEEDLVKGRLDKVEETLTKLVDRLDDLAKRPVEKRRALDGLAAIRKSEEDGPKEEKTQLNKGQVLDKLLEKQQAGDKRVNQNLITKFEISGDLDLVKDIIQ